MPLTDEQKQQRLSGITATDVPKIMGANPYARPIDVYRAKLELDEPFDGNEHTEMGDILEPLCLTYWARVSGDMVTEPGTVEHTTEKWAMATPDGMGSDYVIECKKTSQRWRKPPEHYWQQIQWQMFVTGCSEGVLVAVYWPDSVDTLRHLAGNRDALMEFLVAHGRLDTFYIPRDDEFLALAVERCRDFYFNNVLTATPPDPDGSDSFDHWVCEDAGPTTTGEIAAADDPAMIDEIAAELEKIKTKIKDLEKEKKRHEQRIKQEIRNNDGIEGERYKVTWKFQRGQPGTDWDALEDFLASQGRSLDDFRRDTQRRVLRIGKARRAGNAA